MKSMIVFGLLAFVSAASAQVGGGDVPSDAKAQGTMQNGSSSTGMSTGEARQRSGMRTGAQMKATKGAMKRGSMTRGQM